MQDMRRLQDTRPVSNAYVHLHEKANHRRRRPTESNVRPFVRLSFRPIIISIYIVSSQRFFLIAATVVDADKKNGNKLWAQHNTAKKSFALREILSFRRKFGIVFGLRSCFQLMEPFCESAFGHKFFVFVLALRWCRQCHSMLFILGDCREI